ncbi:MAG: class SAM-dependent methyltransferase [Candidatus Saccharibacteria bacterium]|nr:class SAM-dependent methyltransferase [Candidatus Saccharibacteria bacterium]
MPYTEADSYFNRHDSALNETFVVGDREEMRADGIRIEYVQIADGCEREPGRQEVQSTVARMDQMLVKHPEWKAPYFDANTQKIIFDPANESAELLYGDSETLLNWGYSAMQAHATALYPLQRPHADRLPSGEEIDDKSRNFFYHGLDAIGIRTRAMIMTEISTRYLNDKPAARWISLACGGAVPVIDALKAHEDIGMIHLDLVDYNSDALAFASELATHEASLQQVPTYNKENELRSYSIHEANLVRGLIASDSLVDQFGESSSDMVDALGIFEYFSKKDSTKFLKNAYRMVGDGGVMVIANMLADRPQMEFNRRGVGWPQLYPRSIDELSQIIIDAEINPDNAKIIISEDGVYAVVEIRK